MPTRRTMFASLPGALLLAPVAPEAAGPAATPETAVTGTLSGGALTGALTVERFGGGDDGGDDGVRIFGTLRATLTRAGERLGTVTAVPVEVPVTRICGAPSGLRLALAPVHLDLLGFMVHLNGAVIDLPAVAGRCGRPGTAMDLVERGGAPAAEAYRLNRLLGLTR